MSIEKEVGRVLVSFGRKKKTWKGGVLILTLCGNRATADTDN